MRPDEEIPEISQYFCQCGMPFCKREDRNRHRETCPGYAVDNSIAERRKATKEFLEGFAQRHPAPQSYVKPYQPADQSVKDKISQGE